MKVNTKIIGSEVITLHNDKFFENQKIAGKCVAEIFCNSQELLNKDLLNIKEIENMARDIFKKYNALPTFHNYKGFPSLICISINDTIVHGIVTDCILSPGDIISIDLGATYNGAIADAARTFIYKEPRLVSHVRMVQTCFDALDAGISAISIGNKIGSIGNAIYDLCKKTNYGLLTNYGGHGLDINKPHASPFVANRDNSDSGARFDNGMSLAIEPMLVMGKPDTFVAKDGWSVKTKDKSWGAHFEDTIFIKDDKVINMTREL